MKRCPQCNTQCDDAKIYCHNCGTLLPTATVPPTTQPTPRPQPTPQPAPPPTPKPTPQSKKKGSLLTAVLLLLSVIGNIFLGVAIYYLGDDRDYYEYKYDQYFHEYLEVLQPYEFYNNYARIVPDDGSGKYHRYGCEYLDEDADFWIYNKENAVNVASPCARCCADD